MAKYFISGDELFDNAFLLAEKVLSSGFRPNFLVGIWRGGTPVGIAVQEYLALNGVKTDHIAIMTRRYDNEKIDQAADTLGVYGLEYLIDRANSNDSVLLIDDVYDTGLTIQGVISELQRRSRKNTPKIKTATVYYKPNRNQTNMVPNFYLHETDDWLVFPHELSGLTSEEIIKNKGRKTADLFSKKP